MTEAERAELLDLAHEMRARIIPGDTMHSLWEWIAELECCANGQRTLLGWTPEALLAAARDMLAKVPGATP